MAMPQNILQIVMIFSAFTGSVAQAAACADDVGVSCQSDLCLFDSQMRCQCKMTCNAPVECPGEAGDKDMLCECPFKAVYCDPFIRTTCPTTCGLRDVVTCDPLMEMEGTSPLVNGVALTPTSPTPTPGPLYMDVVTYGCTVGWEQKSGRPSTEMYKRVCTRDGSWLLHPHFQTPPLVCERKSCGAPPAVAGATPSSPIGYFSDHVTYTCKAGYALIGGGNGNSTCMAGGSWGTDDAPPLCVRSSVTLFVKSGSESQSTPTPTSSSNWAVVLTRSRLQCARLCAGSASCYGFHFPDGVAIGGDCRMFMGLSPVPPVVVPWVKLYG